MSSVIQKCQLTTYLEESILHPNTAMEFHHPIEKQRQRTHSTNGSSFVYDEKVVFDSVH